MTKVVCFLQNAWSPMYAGGRWPRQSWLLALHRSRSGQRLRIMRESAGDIDWWYDNTTPEVAATPSGICAPDLSYISQVLKDQSPDYIVGCGKQAEVLEAIAAGTPLLLVPHPAYRVLTDSLYREAGTLLVNGFSGIRRLQQGRPTAAPDAPQTTSEEPQA